MLPVQKPRAAVKKIPIMPKSNILQKIIAYKKIEIENARQRVSESELLGIAGNMPHPRSLSGALRGKQHLSVIAEIKKASPSAGVLRENFDHHRIAASYQMHGADALSVLTDEKFFQGHLDFIRDLHPTTHVPMLRKDFLIDRYQICEARAAGADAVLLIVAALTPPQLGQMLRASSDCGMDALVEVHTLAEAQIAMQAGAEVIGINNRNLETFEIDLSTTEQIAAQIPSGKIIVAESGMTKADDLVRMQNAGADAVLIGSHFMREPDPGTALARLLDDMQWQAEHVRQ